MSWILLTNDDGVASPAVAPFARALSRLGQVRVVVPDRERSWVGKAVTRHDPVSVGKVRRGGIDVWTCSGYPADAAQLGIHALFDEPPALVVSGINLGFNHGAGFLMSSGTVGAAVEGWVSGIPAIAFSTGQMGKDYDTWRRWCTTSDAEDDWARLAAACTELVRDVRRWELTDVADVVSINIPFDADSATPRRLTTIARIGYDRLFQPSGPSTYRHEFSSLLHFDALDGTDVETVTEGNISITPLRMPAAADVPDRIRQQLER